MFLHGFFEGLTQLGGIGWVVFYVVVVFPVAGIPFFHYAFAAVVIMSGEERLVARGEVLQSFQFGRYHDVALVVAAYVKRYYAYLVSGDKVFVFFLVVKRECENTAEVFQEIYAFLAV